MHTGDLKQTAVLPVQFVDLKAQYAELREEIDGRMKAVLAHGNFIMGPEVYELEERLAEYVGAQQCITCASGTEALLISLMGLGIGAGDEVITTPFTFAATAEVIALLGATPVFVDIEPDTFNMTTSGIAAAVTSRTRAIMPVSLYGQPADMREINALANEHGLPVIEDAAQSFGAEYQGRKSGNLSTIGCTSFFPSKPLGCYGDGGAIFTSDSALAQSMREIRTHGQSRRYYHTRVGLGGRMDTLQCAIVLAKLTRFDWELGQRKSVAKRYSESLQVVGVPTVKADRTSAYAQYTITTDARAVLERSLAERKIPTAVHYPIGLHLQPAYREISRWTALPNTEAAAQSVISLPIHPYLDDGQVSAVIQAVNECVQP